MHSVGAVAAEARAEVRGEVPAEAREVLSAASVPSVGLREDRSAALVHPAVHREVLLADRQEVRREVRAADHPEDGWLPRALRSARCMVPPRMP
jgi:hypothetical protein